MATFRQKAYSYLTIDDDLVLSPFASDYLIGRSDGFLVLGMNPDGINETAAYFRTIARAKKHISAMFLHRESWAIYDIAAKSTIYIARAVGRHDDS